MLAGYTRRSSMENVSLQITLKESGRFPWTESCMSGRMGIYGCQPIHAQKDQGTLGLEKTVLLEIS